MKTLLKLSLAISFLGVLLLLLISTSSKPKQISNYSELKLDELVTTQGKIISIQTFDDFSIINLENNVTATCNCQFKKGENIEVTGKVTSYQKQLQIQSDKIKIKPTVL